MLFAGQFYSAVDSDEISKGLFVCLERHIVNAMLLNGLYSHPCLDSAAERVLAACHDHELQCCSYMALVMVLADPVNIDTLMDLINAVQHSADLRYDRFRYLRSAEGSRSAGCTVL